MAFECTINEQTLFVSQEEMESLFSKHQLKPYLRSICLSRGYDVTLRELKIPVEFGLDLLSQMMLYKRAQLPTLVGLLRHHFKDTDEMSAAQQCVEMLIHCVDQDAISYSTEDKIFIVEHDITKSEQHELDKFQYPLPMIEEPDPVTNNRETGYRTIPGSLILKKNHHDEDICLDHVNRMNSIPLSLNIDVVAFIQNKWSDLEKQRDDEDYQEYKARIRAFKKYDRSSREVLTALMAGGNRFWLTHKYDKRGRTYCQGYHVSYQGNDYNKACIEFADGEPLNQE